MRVFEKYPDVAKFLDIAHQKLYMDNKLRKKNSGEGFNLKPLPHNIIFSVLKTNYRDGDM